MKQNVIHWEKKQKQDDLDLTVTLNAKHLEFYLHCFFL